MKKLLVLIIGISLLAGCSTTYKTAKDVGKGVSVEVQSNEAIKHLRIEQYVDGVLRNSENVINANNSVFEEGEITIFDIPVHLNEEVEFLVRYSENVDGTNDSATDKVRVNSKNSWVNLILNKQLQLEIEE